MGHERHGLTKHPLYKRWLRLKAKCKYPWQSGYELYGGRGITMCSEWEHNFSAFYKWCMTHGWKPELILTLKEGAEEISPTTLLVVDQKQRQGRKRTAIKYEYEGEFYCVRDLCKKLGLNYNTVMSRVNLLGWSLKDALFKEVRPRKGGKSAKISNP